MTLTTGALHPERPKEGSSMWIKMIRDTVVKDLSGFCGVREAGEVLEVEDRLGRQLVYTKKADEAKAPPAQAPAKTKDAGKSK